eukprot:CAMPEP_0197432076 /NCGR_PEP_ID=MMETSP1175-20131217/198_1 /TAXON_ID=1003142 /ORGANISM="Triceratium dubium, Strain CCMP147" /LENGTH=41 /DNA_ID= /DNA_START= /DNA_END= /DNA_ORIENTATION=
MGTRTATLYSLLTNGQPPPKKEVFQKCHLPITAKGALFALG